MNRLGFRQVTGIAGDLDTTAGGARRIGHSGPSKNKAACAPCSSSLGAAVPQPPVFGAFSEGV
jgi:hypothetical protein